MSVLAPPDADEQTRELIVHNGIDYITFLSHIISYFRCERYLEIGTQKGVSLARVNCDAIAIDPQFNIDRPIMGGKEVCLLFQMSSDRFFAKHDPAKLLGGPIDVAFLDGMHRHEYLLRDFANLERFSKRNSIICLHDCLPPTLEMTVREDKGSSMSEKYKGYWTGDVWKAAEIIQSARPDIHMSFIDCPPTGLVVCTNLTPANRVLDDQYFDLLTAKADNLPGQPSATNRLEGFLRSRPLLKSQELMKGERLTEHFWL